MPHPKSDLPPLPSSFSVTEAMAAGVSKNVLRHPRFARPFYGVRAAQRTPLPTESRHEQVLRAAREFLPRLRPGEAFSHTSALLLHGCPIRIAPDLHVIAQPGYASCRTRGVIGHRSSWPVPVSVLDKLPVVSPMLAIVQSAGQLSILELVVALDHLIRPRGLGKQRPLVDEESLVHAAQHFHGRGAGKLRLALTLMRVGSESRMETLTRMLLTAFGMERCFELQSELSDSVGWIGRFDLVDRRRKVIVEFDGDQHRTDKAQYEKDLRRLDRVRAAGYLVIRLLSEDVLRQPEATAARIAAALGQDLAPHPLRDLLLVRRP